MPESPESNVPESRESNVPESPESNVPESHESHVPELPESNVPESPASNVPKSPESHVPESPDSHVPELPEQLFGLCRLLARDRKFGQKIGVLFLAKFDRAGIKKNVGELKRCTKALTFENTRPENKTAKLNHIGMLDQKDQQRN